MNTIIFSSSRGGSDFFNDERTMGKKTDRLLDWGDYLASALDKPTIRLLLNDKLRSLFSNRVYS